MGLKTDESTEFPTFKNESERGDWLQSEVLKISQFIASLGAKPPRSGVEAAKSLQPISFPAGRAKMARAELRRRRQRDRFFTADTFAEPAWDMLLDLYAAHYEGHPVSVSSLCIAAAVPATTALRWIKTLEDAGWFERSCDPLDGRRIFIALSESSRVAMDKYFFEIEY